MNVFQTVLAYDVGADRPTAGRGAAPRRTMTSRPKYDRTLRMVPLHKFEIEMVLRAFKGMRDRAWATGDFEAADYFNGRGAEIKKAAQIRGAA